MVVAWILSWAGLTGVGSGCGCPDRNGMDEWTEEQVDLCGFVETYKRTRGSMSHLE